MSLKELILADLKDAMKNKEADRLGAIRFLQAAIKNKEIDVRPSTITDEDILGVIKKAVKQRKESIEQYTNANRQDLADKEAFELSVIEKYLPAQMEPEQIKMHIEKVIAALGATSMKDMGAVMKQVQADLSGRADGKLVSEIVKSKLS